MAPLGAHFLGLLGPSRSHSPFLFLRQRSNPRTMKSNPSTEPPIPASILPLADSVGASVKTRARVVRAQPSFSFPLSRPRSLPPGWGWGSDLAHSLRGLHRARGAPAGSGVAPHSEALTPLHSEGPLQADVLHLAGVDVLGAGRVSSPASAGRSSLCCGAAPWTPPRPSAHHCPTGDLFPGNLVSHDKKPPKVLQ